MDSVNVSRILVLASLICSTLRGSEFLGVGSELDLINVLNIVDLEGSTHCFYVSGRLWEVQYVAFCLLIRTRRLV